MPARHKVVSIRCMAVMLLFISIGLAEEKLVAIKIPEVSAAPLLDGKIDDTCWQTAAKIDELFVYREDKISKDTTFWICRDDAWLYLAAKCRNVDMQHVEQTAFKHDSPVFKDDSIEIYITPGNDDKRTRHFMLNFANVKYEKTFELGFGWGCPWRSVTTILPDGWEAEVAIPLCALDDGDMCNAKINLLRNKIIPETDNVGAKQGERREVYALSQGTVRDFAKYVALQGLDNLEVRIPFAPYINQITLGMFDGKSGAYSYPLTLFLSPGTETTGSVEVFILEEQNERKVEHKGGLIVLDAAKQVTIDVPLENFMQRSITVVLRDQSGGLLASRSVDDIGNFAIVTDAFVGRSYYTSEENAEIKVVFGVSAEMLERFHLRITNEAGAVLFEKDHPEPETMAAIPLSRLELGRNQVKLAITSNGKELFSSAYEICKLPPNPGCEVKADFIRKVILKDGEPFFPIGIDMMSLDFAVDEEHIKMMSDIGFNMIMPSANSPFPGNEGMELARKYNLQLIFEPLGQNQIDLISEKISAHDTVERRKLARENYEQKRSTILERVDILKKHSSLFMYFTGHEPNLGDALVQTNFMRWVGQELMEIDPYRPKLAVYTKHIPEGDEWTRWVDVLSDDIYIRPWTGAGLLAQPGRGNAFYANKIRLRCEKDHKIMFMVPLAGQHSIDKGPVGNSNPQMLCQNYVSLIYGAKGTLFFCNTTVANYHSWEGIKTICQQTRHLAPALLNYEVKQAVSYPGQEYDPLSAIFPQVLGRVFKYPDGDYLLLVANLLEYGADVTFTLPGLSSAVREFGDHQSWHVDNDAFSEKLEPYGTRAYRVKGDLREPLALSVVAQPDKTVSAPSVDIPGIIDRMRLEGKNYCPNPCFERQLLPGTPDFYKPYFNHTKYVIYNPGIKNSAWFVDYENQWEGRPSLCMDRTAGTNTPLGTYAGCYPPVSEKPMEMTLSFYAKAAQNGDSLIVNCITLAKERKTLKLSDQWRRYFLPPLTVNPPRLRNNGVRTLLFLPQVGAKVWISGLQLEYGSEPTEFRDDSIPEKKK